MPVGIETTKQEEKMKKFLVVLLSLGLIAAFGMTASAADMKVGGSYYVVGAYEDNPTLKEDSYSRAYIHQRIRIQPVFKIAEGLTFTARMDAMEKQWGDSTWRRNAVGGDDTTSSRRTTDASNKKIQQNFEWERGYVTFMTGIGRFQVGYQAVDTWGTVFGDSGTTRPRFQYLIQTGPMTFLFNYEKVYEADMNIAATANKVDADNDSYALAGFFKQGPVEAGLLYKYYDFKATRVAGGKAAFHLLSPYVKATFGPVFIESEVDYFFGKGFKSEIPGVADVKVNGWGAYIHAKVNLGPAWVGAQVGYSSGDDYADTNKSKTNPGGAGTDWNPALILLNDEITGWTNARASSGRGYPQTSQKFNVIIYNVYAGFKPMPKLEVGAALTYMTAADRHLNATTEAISKKLGTEFDVTATYKIYDNLSYMVGAGYLWTGDYFKGASATATVDNDYMLMNKLSLSF